MGVRNCADLGENLQKILKYLMADDALKKLLYYTDKDPLAHTSSEAGYPTTADIYNKLIRIIPLVKDTETAQSIIVLKIDNCANLKENGEFKTVNFSFEVFVPFTQWMIKDTNLRPFAILGRLQELLNGLKINGLGTLGGGDFELNFLTEEMSCYVAHYSLISYD